jgi:hypothetical protein
MTAISQRSRLTEFAGVVPSRGSYPIAANVWIKKGGQIGLNSAGECMPAGLAAAGLVQILGKSSAEYDNRTGSALGGLAGATDVEAEFGVFDWENSAGGDEITAAHIGRVVYAEDDQTVALTDGSATRIAAGIVTEVRDGIPWVWQGPGVASFAEATVLAGAGMTVQKRTVTIGHADLTVAGTTETENIGAVLPANARIVGVDIRALTAFSGGGTGAQTVDIGTAGDVDALVDGSNLFAAAVDGGPSTMPPGIRPNKTFVSAGAQLIATFITDTTQAAFTAGSVIIDVLFVELA